MENNKTKLFDSHAHLLKDSYKDDLEAIIEDTFNHLEFALNIAWDLKTSQEVIDLNKQFPNLYPVIGIHPNQAFEYDVESARLALSKLIENNKVYAIGEIGIDLFRSDNLDKQIEILEMQLELAKKYDLPVIFHVRDAYKELMKVMEKHSEIRALFHSWNSTFEDAQSFLKINPTYHFAFNGIVTYKNKTEDVNDSLLKLDNNLIFIETDAPWLSPVPHRGKTNYPKYVKHIFDYIVAKKNISNPEDFLNKMNLNIKKFFNL